jgi:hypothetical protein
LHMLFTEYNQQYVHLSLDLLILFIYISK